MTDEATQYKELGNEFARHEREPQRRGIRCAATHPHQYGRGLLFDLQARHERHLPALREKHLHRYLAEFDFRYCNRVRLGMDDGGAERAFKGIVGKRLTYRTTGH